MEVIAPPRTAERPAVVPVVGGTILATFLIVLGVVLAWLMLATPLLSAVLPDGRADTGQLLTGGLVWAFALVAPAAFLLLGANRLARILVGARERMPKPSRLVRAMDGLPSDVTFATSLSLPDGRSLSGLVIGPFGGAVIRELPPASVTRIHNGHWEVRTRRGWIPMEDPRDRASRDAERVRRWFAHDDADFVVKTYAAVVGDDAIVPRSAMCAVVRPDQIAAWITALPPQRSLTPGRRDRLLGMVRDAAR